MPHLILEYTDNINEEADIPGLLKKIHEVMIERDTVFPIGGIRSRAIELKDYLVADGTEDDAFVHATLKIGRGRDENVKKEASEAIFQVMKEHFSSLMNSRYLALSFELYEFGEAGTLKANNIHTRYKK